MEVTLLLELLSCVSNQRGIYKALLFNTNTFLTFREEPVCVSYQALNDRTLHRCRQHTQSKINQWALVLEEVRTSRDCN